MKVAFVHPDLGIGGAERLVVDAALGLQKLGHSVTIYTSYCDKSHCFEEVKDGTLNVVVGGNTIVPPKLFGRFSILCAILRQIHLIVSMLYSSPEFRAVDVFVVDQLSACVPLLRWLSKSRVVFYCHFPDQLLALPGGLVKKLYRIPFDAFESWTTGLADIIVVNSKFTRTVFHKTFKAISQTPQVIYPCVAEDVGEKEKVDIGSHRKFVVSVNRFERKKNINLALQAFAQSEYRKDALLVLAGGYDPRVTENVEYLQELEKECDKQELKYAVLKREDSLTVPDSVSVVFLPSVSTPVKNWLLEQAQVLLYTPTNEHFGIVPLEAMQVGTPVLATNTGGPLETVVEGETGWNRPSEVSQWAKQLDVVLTMSPEKRQQMGKSGQTRVKNLFSFDKMAKEFEATAQQATKIQRSSYPLVVIVAIVLVCISILVKIVH